MADELDLMTALGLLMENAAEAMQEVITDTVLARSQELVPRDTETLAQSARVSDPMIEIGHATVVLSYGQPDDVNPKTGGSSADYAVTVHERLDVPHPTGQAKWLEQSVLEAAPTFAAQVAAKIAGR